MRSALSRVFQSKEGTAAFEERNKRKDSFFLRWIDSASEISGYLSGACIFIAMLVICYAIIWRALGYGTVWQTELTVYLLMVVTFIGGAYGAKHGHHVKVDLIINWLPARGQLVAQLIAGSLSLFLVAMVAWYSYGMWWEATVRGVNSGTSWNPPLTYPYATLVVGMILMTLQYLAIISRTIRQLASRSYNGIACEDPNGKEENKGGRGVGV